MMNSILNRTSDKLQILRLIAENMVKTRPQVKVEYRPCIKQIGVKRNRLSFTDVDLKEIYPEATVGDVVYASVTVDVPHDETVSIGVKGNVKIFFRGEEICRHNNTAEPKFITADVIKGGNKLTIECQCTEESFGFSLIVATKYYPKMEAKDYLFHVDMNVPLDEFRGEEGFAFSKLYKKEIPHSECEYVLPTNSGSDENIDFNSVYKTEKDGVGWALSYFSADGTIEISSADAVYVNRKKCDDRILKLRKNDEILVMCKNSKNGWGFRAKGVENLAVPFLNSARAKGDKWLLLGTLPDDSLIDVQFTKPYIDEKSNKCFWRFSDGISYLRPFLRTSFFGQWFYAIMVGLYGLNNASVLLGDEYRNYFKESVKTMVQYFDYMKYDAEIFGSPSFLQRSIGLKDLDSIGTVGMNMADFYKMTEDSDTKAVLRVLSDAVKENIPTFDDGTFHREKTMWADDLYMSCPFLVRMGEIEKNEDYFNECIRQIEGFKKRLYNEDEKIFSHIYFLEDEKKNNVPWGRGNGWIFFTLSELLLKLPSSEEKAGLAKLFSEFAEGVRTLQGKSGMWHQVLNDNSTYRETSCTAMFILGLVRGIKNGWIDRGYLETVEKAWQGLFENAVDFDGNIWGVCRGSGCSYDSKYYAELSTVVNDDHGTGVVLAALCETILLERDI